VTHSTTQSKFNGGSIYFDGTGDYLSVADSADWTFGTGDFTIDLWIYPTTIGSGGNKNYVGTNPNQYLTFASNNSGGLLFYYGNGTWTSTPAATSNVVVNDAWQHVAVSRSGGTVYLFHNGVLMTSRSQSASIDPPNIEIGAYGGGASDLFVGYMDELRITKGAALWTQNFTPPARRDTLSISDGMMYNGACLDFDGTNDYVTIPHNSILDNENALTIECWINTSFDAAFPGEVGVIRKGSGSASGWSNAGWSIRLRDDIPAIAFRKKDDTGYWDLYTGDKIIDGNWHHIVGTFDTTTLRKYVDGVQTQSTSTGQAYLTTTENLEIGRISAYLDGSISNVKLYNVALSASQVKELYQDSKVIIPSNVSQTNLKGWWPLVDGAGTIAYDGSGNGNHGTLTNMDPATDWLTAQTGAPQLVEGYNRPMLFDGSNDYLEVPDDSSFDTTTKVSIAAWVYADPSLAAGSRGGQIVYTRDGEKGYGLRMRNDGSGGLEVRFSTGSGGFGHLSGSTALTAGRWYHLCGTYDTAVGRKVYVNGVLDGSDTATGNLDKGTGVIQLGTRGGGNMFGGIFNEVIIYNSTLSLAQIQALATGAIQLVTNGTFDSDLTGWTTTATNGATVVASGGKAVLTDVVSGLCMLTTASAITVEVGKVYRASFQPGGYVGNYQRYYIGTTAGASDIYNSGYSSTWAANTPALQEVYFTATHTDVFFSFHNANDTGAWTVDDVSLIESSGPLPPDPMSLSNSSDIAGYWRNDSNLSWTDLSGNGNDTGSASGSPDTLLFKQGINGSASTSTGRDNQGFPLLYQNNGAIGFVSDSVDFGNVVSFDNTDNFTVEAWFKAALDGSGNGFSYQPIISKEGSAEFGYGIKLDYNVAGGPWLYGIATGTTSRYQYSSALNAGQWYHACVTFNSSANYITVFIDGAQNHGPYLVQGAFNGTTNTNSLKLGNGSYYTADFSGQIGSSKIYNRLLSQAEITQNYKAQRSRFT
jgi:hypothetical protein